MTITANLKFTQGVTVGTAGKSFIASSGSNVTIENNDNTNVDTWEYRLLDAPSDSAHVPGVLSTTSTATLNPDVAGSYRVQVTVAGDGETPRSQIRNIIVKTSRNWILPSFLARAADFNYLDNIRGWADALEFILKDIHDNAFGGGGGSGDLGASVIIEDPDGGLLDLGSWPDRVTTLTLDYENPDDPTNYTIDGPPAGRSAWLAIHNFVTPNPVTFNGNEIPSGTSFWVYIHDGGVWHQIGGGGGFTAGGDLTGTSSSQTVSKLQNVDLLATSPLGGDVLMFDNLNSRYSPTTQFRSTVVSSTGVISGLTTSDSAARPYTSMRFSGAAPEISGMSGGWNGRFFFIHATGGSIVVHHQDTVNEATAANRVITPSGADETIPNNYVGMFLWSATTSRWHLVLVGGTSGGAPDCTEPAELHQVEQQWKDAECTESPGSPYQDMVSTRHPRVQVTVPYTDGADYDVIVASIFVPFTPAPTQTFVQRLDASVLGIHHTTADAYLDVAAQLSVLFGHDNDEVYVELQTSSAIGGFTSPFVGLSAEVDPSTPVGGRTINIILTVEGDEGAMGRYGCVTQVHSVDVGDLDELTGP